MFLVLFYFKFLSKVSADVESLLIFSFNFVLSVLFPLYSLKWTLQYFAYNDFSLLLHAVIHLVYKLKYGKLIYIRSDMGLFKVLSL